MLTRRLIVMRHAKSSWKTDAPTDHARPLNKRGRRDAPAVGAELARLGWTPAAVISSDSVRTTETLARMSEPLGFTGEPTLTRELYHGGLDEIRAMVGELPDDVPSVLVLGHNPGWEEAAEFLSGQHLEMKTACAALLSIDAASWRETLDQPGRWTLEHWIAPRALRPSSVPPG